MPNLTAAMALSCISSHEFSRPRGLYCKYLWNPSPKSYQLECHWNWEGWATWENQQLRCKGEMHWAPPYQPWMSYLYLIHPSSPIKCIYLLGLWRLALSSDSRPSLTMITSQKWEHEQICRFGCTGGDIRGVGGGAPSPPQLSRYSRRHTNSLSSRSLSRSVLGPQYWTRCLQTWTSSE